MNIENGIAVSEAIYDAASKEALQAAFDALKPMRVKVDYDLGVKCMLRAFHEVTAIAKRINAEHQLQHPGQDCVPICLEPHSIVSSASASSVIVMSEQSQEWEDNPFSAIGLHFTAFAAAAKALDAYATLHAALTDPDTLSGEGSAEIVLNLHSKLQGDLI